MTSTLPPQDRTSHRCQKNTFSIIQCSFSAHTLHLLKQECCAYFCPQAMPAIRNTKKSLVEHLLLKQESVKDKSLLERIGINPTPSIELYNKLIEADPCWHKVDNLYFSFCPLELHFCKNKKLLCIKEYKELLEPTLDCISPFFTKISKNKTWTEDPQYDSLWKQFN